MMVKFIRDDLQVFILGGSYKDDAQWGIISISGIGTAENDITRESYAVGDGEEITSERIPARNIDISASVKNKSNNVTERRKALAFFTPKHSFTVYITKDAVTRWIVAKLEKFKCPAENIWKHVAINLALLCPDPFFKSYDNYGKNIAAVTGRFVFPCVSPIGTGLLVGTYNFAKQVEIENTGDVEAFSQIIIEANGVVENPKIMHNNAYIRLLDTLASGDRIEIDLVKNTIKKNGINCIGKVDRKSSFSEMYLGVGNNTVSFAADNGDTSMKVILYYNLRYLGV